MRIALGIEYDGTRYGGWQAQPGVRTVQATVEAALSVVAAQPVTVVAAGRTDAGVHALSQVAHFDSGAARTLRNWVLGANANLPPDVALRWAREVPDEFHARFSATARTYRYLVGERPTRLVLERERAVWIHEPLDLGRMQSAAAPLCGRHDFSGFRSSECQAKTPVRTVRRLLVERDGSCVRITIEADAFLQHMVRNIAGSLIEVGRRRREPAWIAEVLARGDRRLAGPTAPAHGLALEAVDYPRRFGLPRSFRDEWQTWQA